MIDSPQVMSCPLLGSSGGLVIRLNHGACAASERGVLGVSNQNDLLSQLSRGPKDHVKT